MGKERIDEPSEKIIKVKGKGYVLIPYESWGTRKIIALTPDEYDKSVRRILKFKKMGKVV